MPHVPGHKPGTVVSSGGQYKPYTPNKIKIKISQPMDIVQDTYLQKIEKKIHT